MTESKLTGVSPLRQPQQNVVEALEKVLGTAKTGELRAVCVVYEYADGDVGFRYAVGVNTRATSLLGELEVAKTSIVHRYCLREET